MVRDNATGLLFVSGDARDLASKLELLIGDASLRYELGKKGQEFVAGHLSLKNQVDCFSDVLTDTVR